MIEKVVLSGVINPSENLPVSNMYDTERGGACQEQDMIWAHSYSKKRTIAEYVIGCVPCPLE
jgi:hypothetical protein